MTLFGRVIVRIRTLDYKMDFLQLFVLLLILINDETDAVCDVTPEYFKKNTPLRVVVGSNVTLQCITNISVTHEHLLEWSKNDDVIFYKRDSETTPVNPEDKARMRLFAPDRLKNGIASLNISNVTKSDEGNYSCCLRIPYKGSNSVYQSLEVTEQEGQPGGQIVEGSIERPVTTSQNETQDGLSTEMIITISVAVAVVAAVVAAVVIRWRKKGCRYPWISKQKSHDEEAGQPEKVPLKNMDSTRLPRRRSPPTPRNAIHDV